jgi:hypothetical protein
MEDGIEQHLSIMTEFIAKQKMNEHWKIEENNREPQLTNTIQKEENDIISIKKFENKKEKQD